MSGDENALAAKIAARLDQTVEQLHDQYRTDPRLAIADAIYEIVEATGGTDKHEIVRTTRAEIVLHVRLLDWDLEITVHGGRGAVAERN